MTKLTLTQLDALKEVATIGAGNAATSLSKVLNKRIRIRVPGTELLPLEKIPEVLGGPETLVAAVYFQVTGDVSGSLLLVFPLQEGMEFSDLLLGRKKGGTKELDLLAESALKEIGNISSGTYLRALSEMVRMKLVQSVPGLATDMLQAVLDGILSRLALKVENAVRLETEFEVEKERVRGHFLFLPDPEGLDRILEALNVE